MKKILITGANRGIGLELCRELTNRGEEVIAVCRHSNSKLQELNLWVIEGIDVGSTESVNALQAQLGELKLDWLINNAGILSVETLDELSFEAMEQQFKINALGPLRMTNALLPNLSAGAKVGIITSRMGSIEDNTSGSYYGYRMSKAAVNMAGKSLALDVKDKGIAVFLLHPGMVATDMTGGRGVSVQKSASGLVQRMDELGLPESGSFWHDAVEPLPW